MQIPDGTNQLSAADSSLLHSVIRQAAGTELSPRFIASLCHELRSSLNGIIGYTELLRESSLHDSTREIAEALWKSEQTLLATLNTSLEYIGQELSETPLHPRWVHTEQVLNEAMHMVQPLADRKRLQIRTDIAAGVPTCIEVDEVRLEQILINLLNNAVKYTDAGSVGVSVTCPGPDGLTFSVQDTGIGLGDTNPDSLYDPFARGTDSHSRPGTGLGLTIAHTLTERLGGCLQAESRAEGGSWFSFTLRLKSALRLPPAQLPYQPGTIIIGDDEPLSRRVAAHLTGKLHPSAAIFTANNGAEAVSIYQQHGAEVILLDIHMPGMDGLQAVRAIRKLESAHRPRTIAIALTGESSATTLQACRKAGFDTVLAKPINTRSLTAVLQEQLAAGRKPKPGS